jgi:hypothetical protein
MRDMDGRDTRGRGMRDTPSLMGDADRPLYMEHEAASERSSRAWVGIAAFALIAALSGYGWHLYTTPATVEPFPVQSPTRDLAATPPAPDTSAPNTTTPSNQATAQPAITQPPAASPPPPAPAQSLATVGQIATPSDAAANATHDPANTPFRINGPGTAPPAKPDAPKADTARTDTPAPRKEAALDIAPPKPPKAVPNATQTPPSLPPVKLTPPAPVALTPPAPPSPPTPEPALATTVPRPPVSSPMTAEPPTNGPVSNGPVATGRPLPLNRASLPADRDITAPVLRPPNAPSLNPPATNDAPAQQAPAAAMLAPNPTPLAPPPSNAPNSNAPNANAPNTVTVDGVTYVSGQEPHALGTLSSTQPPANDGSTPPPAAPAPTPQPYAAAPYAPLSDTGAPLPNDVIIAPNGQISVPSGQQ